jgi:carboxymethylenebutenolidase
MHLPLNISLLFLSFVFTALMPLTTSAAENIADKKNLTNENKVAITTSKPIYYMDFKGYLAKPSAPGNYPGIVIIHEYWGLNNNIKKVTKQLARQGYTVLAVDLYHGETTTDPDQAARLASQIDQAQAVQNMRSAVDYLQTQEQITKVASLGWCFGGGQSLKLATSGMKLDGTVIYYGQLTAEKNELEKISWPILGIFGAEDQIVPLQSVEKFKSALDEPKIPNQIIVYPGVGHAFANPSGTNYAPEQTQDAWSKTLTFLNDTLKN